MPPMKLPKDTHPPLFPPEFYEWNQRTIQVSGDNFIETVEGAYCYGPLAVHPIIIEVDKIDDVPNDNKYAITSTYGGGRLICATVEVDDAIKIVERLVNSKITCTCFSKMDRQTIVNYLNKDAPWVIPWLIDCRKSGKYLNTKPYKRGIIP